MLFALLVELVPTLPEPPTPTLLAVVALTIKIERNDRLHSARHLDPITGHLALGVKLALRVTQRRATPLMRAQLLGQLVTARIAMHLVLAPVRLVHLVQQFARDPLIAAVRVHRGIRRDLRAIDRDHPDVHQPRLRTQPQNIREQVSQRRLVPLTELRDRRVIRHPHRSNHHERDILRHFRSIPLDDRTPSAQL